MMNVAKLFMSARCCASALIVASAMAAAGSATASVITQNTVGTQQSAGSLFSLGQSVTTSAGGPWNNIAFNFVDTSGNPYANGSLFLLSQAYSGNASALSNATTGFLASTATISAGVWQFDSAVTLAANTQYFLYMNTDFNGSKQVLYSGSNPYTGGTAYQGSPYFSANPADLVFSLNGTVVDTGVPEPSSMALVCLALVGVGALRRAKASA